MPADRENAVSAASEPGLAVPWENKGGDITIEYLKYQGDESLLIHAGKDYDEYTGSLTRDEAKEVAKILMAFAGGAKP